VTFFKLSTAPAQTWLVTANFDRSANSFSELDVLSDIYRHLCDTIEMGAKKRKPSATKTLDREKIAVYLENDQITALRKINEIEDIPIAAQIRRAVKEYLERRR
jgi:hypothetical protein